MKGRILQLVFLGLLIVQGNFACGQVFSENFNGNYLNGGWKFFNNSSALSENSKGWIFGAPNSFVSEDFTDLMDVRNPYSATNPGSQKLTYLYTGYNYGSDIHGSTLSKWAISPLVRVKNGDKIRFRTRQRSTNCNNANKLEVRLSTFRPSSPYYNSSTDSTLYLPVGASQVGNFTNRIGVINENLEKTGPNAYPNDWQVYEFVVSGLGANEYYTGRIAFRYIVVNAGTSSCKSPLNIPALPSIPSTGSGEGDYALSSGIDLALNIADATCSSCGDVIEVGEAGMLAYEMAQQAATTYNNWNGAPSANNGSAIGIDDFEIIPREEVFLYDATNLPSNVVKSAFDKQNLTGTSSLTFGIKGDDNCEISPTIPKTRRFIIYNAGSAPIKVKPHFAGTSSGYPDTSVVLSTSDSITIAARSFASVTLNVNPRIAIGNYYGKFWITDKNNVNLGEARLTILRNSRGNPSALCKTQYPIQIELDANGTPVVLTAPEVNNGSTNGCGGTDNLSFSVSKWVSGYWDYGNNTFTCSDLGDRQVRLRVNDSKGGQSECYASVKVSIAVSSDVDANYVQNYYLGNFGSGNTKMPVSAIVKPPVVRGCSSAVPELTDIRLESASYPGFFNSVGLNGPLGVNQYKLVWNTRINGNIVGGGTTTLNVVDTIKPTVIANADTVKIGFTERVQDAQTHIWYDYVKTSIKGADICRPASYDNTWDYYNNLDYYKSVIRYEISTPWYNSGAWVNEIPFTCANSGQNSRFPSKVMMLRAISG